LILPAGNLLPPSLYLAEKVLDVLATDDCMWHACPNGKCPPWPPMPRSMWPSHQFDKCACGLDRFTRLTRPNGKVDPQPAKVGELIAWTACKGLQHCSVISCQSSEAAIHAV